MATAFDRASVTPNSSDVAAVPMAPLCPMASAASAIQPRPLTMSLENQDTYPMDMKAPPSPLMTPLMTRAMACVLTTLIPTESAASFFSPTALM